MSRCMFLGLRLHCVQSLLFHGEAPTCDLRILDLDLVQ